MEGYFPHKELTISELEQFNLTISSCTHRIKLHMTLMISDAIFKGNKQKLMVTSQKAT